MSEKEDLLKKINFDDVCELLRDIGKSIDVPKNYILCNAGKAPDSCYLVESGKVISYEYTSAGNTNVFVSVGGDGPDSLLLISGTLLEHALTLTFETSEPSRLVRIKRGHLLEAIDSYPWFSQAIINILAYKFIKVNERYRASSVPNATWRVCNLLVTLADQHGVPHRDGILIKTKYSQLMMAEFLHLNRTTVVRILKKLTDEGLVERINNLYCICDMARLKEYMALQVER